MSNDFESKYNESQNEIKELRERLIQAGEEQHKNELQIKDEEIAQLNIQIANMQTEVNEITAKFNEVSKAKEEVETAKASIDKELKEKVVEINTIQAEKAKVDRISILVSAGVDKADAEKLTERFAGVSDEQFEEIVELQKRIIIASNVVVAEDEVVVEDVVAEEVVVDEEVLEDAEVVEEASLATDSSVEDEDNVLISAFANWTDSILVAKNSK